MENKKRNCLVIFSLTIFILFFFSGCNRHPAEPERPYQVVTAIRVLYRNGPREADLFFSEEEKVQTILEYLRKISPYGTPEEDPNQVTGSHFYITLIHSDGSTNTYHQLADRMMRLDDGPWKRIDITLAEKLVDLLGEMSEDDFTSGTPPAPPLLRPELRG